MSAVESPLLTGTHGPIQDESVYESLPVIGELPKDLNGAYFRNGPNARYAGSRSEGSRGSSPAPIAEAAAPRPCTASSSPPR